MIVIQEQPRKAKDQHDRLDFHLSNWAMWMRTGGMTCFHVQGGQNLRGYPQHYDTEVERDKSDQQTAVQVDAVIRGLKALEQAALRCRYLDETWKSPLPIEPVLALAREQVQIGLNRRVIY